MKIQILAATVLLATLATSTASAGRMGGGTVLTITNASGGSIAVGDASLNVSVFGGFATLDAEIGGRAYAGSVLVKSCGCYKKITVTNRSGGSIAVGQGTAGSVVVSGSRGHGYGPKS